MNKQKLYLKIFIAVITILLAVGCAQASSLVVVLDGVKKGNATTRMTSIGTDIAVEEVVSALGYPRTGESQGVVVTFDGRKMEFWNKATVVRVAGNIVALQNPVEFSDGHWWVDKKAAERIFNQFNLSVGRKGAVQFTSEEIVEKSNDTQKLNVKTEKAVIENKPAAKEEPKQSVNKTVQTTDAKKETTSKTENKQSEADKFIEELENKEQKEEVASVSTVSLVKKEFKNKRPIIVIDAGHGAHDPGAIGNGIREKDINLKAALTLGDILKRYGADVRYTRSKDVFLKLQERTAFANKNNADVFISLHCNSLPKANNSVKGVEIYLMASPRDKDSLRLAIEENKEISGTASSVKDLENADRKTRLLLKILGDMQQNNKINESTQLIESMDKKIKENRLYMRKVSQAPFFVLRGAGMPAVLVEMGYLSSAQDAARLNNANYREQLALSIAQGVVAYVKTHVKL